MIRVLSFVLALSTLPPVLAASGKGTSTASQQAVDAEIRMMIDQYYAAWNTLDPANAAPLYGKELDLVFYDIAPLKYVGWEEYRSGVQKEFFDKISSGKLTPNDDLKITRRSNVVWTTLTFRLSAIMKGTGQPLELIGRHTTIWEKRAGKWVIVHEHVSAPLPG